jgi:hypothetical protein
VERKGTSDRRTRDDALNETASFNGRLQLAKMSTRSQLTKDLNGSFSCHKCLHLAQDQANCHSSSSDLLSVKSTITILFVSWRVHAINWLIVLPFRIKQEKRKETNLEVQLSVICKFFVLLFV